VVGSYRSPFSWRSTSSTGIGGNTIWKASCGRCFYSGCSTTSKIRSCSTRCVFSATHRSPRLKFLCPKSIGSKDSNGRYFRICSCENPCSTSPYGRCVYVHQNQNLRLYLGISRDDPKFEAIYKQRTTIERSISSLKQTLCLDGRKTSNVLTTKADHSSRASSNCCASCLPENFTSLPLPAVPACSWLPDPFSASYFWPILRPAFLC